jgi:hypothetical protein
MKMLAAFLLWGLSSVLLAQPPSQTFTSADGMFQFRYPSSLVPCAQQWQKGDDLPSWIPNDSCDAMTPVCDDRGSQGSTTLVCIAYPKAEFQGYQEFNAAAFAVAEIKQAVTEKECLSGSTDWNIEAGGTGKTTNINNVEFKVFAISEAGMSHYLNGRVYRTFHRNACYELSIRMATTNPGVFDGPIKEFTQQDRDRVNSRLEQALVSFRFLK